MASLVHSNPQLASDIARLITPVNAVQFDNKGQRTVTRPNTSDLKIIGARVAQNIDDADAVLDLFSDVKIAAEILISSIKSPNDMYEGDVLFKLKDNLHTTPLSGKLMPLIRSYFKDVYPLSDKFDKILRSCLFGAGSFPILVIPENSLSDLIHNGTGISTESLAPHLGSDGNLVSTGLLGPAVTSKPSMFFSVESRSGLLNKPNPHSKSLTYPDSIDSTKTADNHKITCQSVVVLDNPNVLYTPLLNRLARESRTTAAMGSMGKRNKLNDRELASLLYKKATGRRAEFVKLKTDSEIERYSVGKPLVLDLPPESVIPIINRGRPDDPVGFIVTLDSDGVPLSKVTEISQFEAMKKTAKTTQPGSAGGYGDMSSYLLQRAASAFGTTNEEITIRQVNQIFGEILEADLSARLRNGGWGNEVTVGNSTRLAELMLYRVFAQQHTQVLFVPAEMLTYFNYQVSENGVGENLLQNSLVLSSMRAQVLFARVLGAIKNSIGRTRVDVEIDPDEPDSQGVFDLIKSEVVRAKQVSTTPNSVNPTDVLNQIQASGIEFQVTGAKGLPATKAVFSETNTNYARPDEGLSEELASLLINHIGVPPEMVKDAGQLEFATVAISKHILFSKRVRDMQKVFDPQLSHITRNMLMCDATFVGELKKLITENIEVITKQEKLHEEIEKLKDNIPALVDLLCTEFISGLDATLARPDMQSAESNIQALESYEKVIDKALDNIYSQEASDPSLVGEKTYNALEAIKKTARAALIRRFMTENGMADQAFELISAGEDGTLAWDLRNEVAQFSELLAKTTLNIARKTSRIAAAADLEQDKLVQVPEPEASSGGSSSGSDYGSTDDGMGSTDMGGDMGTEDGSTAEDTNKSDGTGTDTGKEGEDDVLNGIFS